MLEKIIIIIAGLIGAVAYKLCVPFMFILVACKLWYEPYAWSWLATIFIPLLCGTCGFFIAVIAKWYSDNYF